MNAAEPISPRLHVLLASKASLGLVIRRGPTKQVCTLLWDRRADTFTLGQWLKGRIYERRCDLSPDGKYFIYFAMNARRSRQGPYCWTAVSRAPWLRAIALYGDEETWLGGGYFHGHRSYTVHGGPMFQVLQESTEVTRRQPKPATLGRTFAEMAKTYPYPITGDLGLYFPRLEREGWTLLEKVDDSQDTSYYLWDKPVSSHWTLRKTVHYGESKQLGKGAYWDEHTLLNRNTEAALPFPEWEWADVDRSRLTWARAGQLWAGKLNTKGLYGEKMLFDFNDMMFQAIKAPYGQ